MPSHLGEGSKGCTVYVIPVCCSAFIAAFLRSTRISDVALWNTSTALPINNPACAPPENPGNGYLLPVYGPQDKLVAVRYKCYPPFTLIGSHQRVCQRDATWSGAVPICVKGAPPTAHSASLFIHGAFLSVILTLCKYNQAGQTSGSRCPPPPKLQNGYHKPSPATAGGVETIEYFCNRPYILGGSQRLTCSSHGSWSGGQPKCVRGSARVVLEGCGRQNMDSDCPPFPLKFTHSRLLLQPVDSPECQNS